MALITCKECGKEVSDQAKWCPDCGWSPISGRTSARAASVSPLTLPPEAKAEKKSNQGAWIFVIAAFATIAIFGRFKDDGSSRPGGSTGPSIGDMVSIRLPGRNDEPLLCVTRDAQDQFTKLAVANDTIGIASLALADLCFLIEPGASARLIDSGLGVKQVRIMSGRQFARAGWLPSEWVGPYSAPPSPPAPVEPKPKKSKTKKS